MGRRHQVDARYRLGILLFLASATYATPAASRTSENIPSAREIASAALFERMATVMTHPRCLNCHTNGAAPKQGDDRHLHIMDVVRGLTITVPPLCPAPAVTRARTTRTSAYRAHPAGIWLRCGWAGKDFRRESFAARSATLGEVRCRHDAFLHISHRAWSDGHGLQGPTSAATHANPRRFRTMHSCP